MNEISEYYSYFIIDDDDIVWFYGFTFSELESTFKAIFFIFCNLQEKVIRVLIDMRVRK